MMKKVLILLSLTAFGSSVLAADSSSSSTSNTTTQNKPQDKPVEHSKDDIWHDYEAFYKCLSDPKNSKETIDFMVSPNPQRYEHGEAPPFGEEVARFKRDTFKGELLPVYEEGVDPTKLVFFTAPYYTTCFFTTTRNMLEDVKTDSSPQIPLSQITKRDFEAILAIFKHFHELSQEKAVVVVDNETANAQEEVVDNENKTVNTQENVDNKTKTKTVNAPRLKALYDYLKNKNNPEPPQFVKDLMQSLLEFDLDEALQKPCGSPQRVLVTDVASRLILFFNFVDSEFMLHGIGRMIAKSIRGCDLQGMAEQLHKQPPESEMKDYLKQQASA